MLKCALQLPACDKMFKAVKFPRRPAGTAEHSARVIVK